MLLPSFNTFQAFLRSLSQGHEPDQSRFAIEWYQWLPRVSNGYQWLLVINKLLMVINSYQGLLMVISQLSKVINGHQWLSMIISQLSMVINCYWLSTSYKCLLRVVNGYQSVINCQRLLIINKLSMIINDY